MALFGMAINFLLRVWNVIRDGFVKWISIWSNNVTVSRLGHDEEVLHCISLLYIFIAIIIAF